MKKVLLHLFSLAFLCLSCSSEPVVKVDGITSFEKPYGWHLGIRADLFSDTEGSRGDSPSGFSGGNEPFFIESEETYLKYENMLPEVEDGFFEHSGLFIWDFPCPSSFKYKLSQFSFVTIEDIDNRGEQLSAHGLYIYATCGEGTVEKGYFTQDVSGYSIILGMKKELYAKYTIIIFHMEDKATYVGIPPVSRYYDYWAWLDHKRVA